MLSRKKIPQLFILSLTLVLLGQGCAKTQNTNNGPTNTNNVVANTNQAPGGDLTTFNTKFGFSFQYPADKVKIDDTSNYLKVQDKNTSHGIFEFQVDENTSVDTVLTSIEQIDASASDPTKRENVTLGGQAATRLTGFNNNKVLHYYTSVALGSGRVLTIWWPGDDSPAGNKEIYEQMISTVSFNK